MQTQSCNNNPSVGLHILHSNATENSIYCVFTKPAKEGQVVKIYGEIESIGNTSITINLEMRIHNVRTGKQDVIVHTKMKFVSIDEEGNSLPITEKVKNKYKKLEIINN